MTVTGVSEPALAAAYSADYYGGGTKKFLAPVEQLLGKFVVRRARKLLQMTDVAPARVLDIGCGRGQLLEAFRQQGAEVVGLEREEFPERPAYVHIGALQDARFAAEKFDIIIIWHVLEHLTSMQKTLDAIDAHLTDNGTIAIAVPNFASWQSRFFKGAWFHLDLPRHLLHIEDNQLISELLVRDFEIVAVSHFDILQNVFGFIQSTLNLALPRHNNACYRLLKHAEKTQVLPLLGWNLAAIAIAPLALIELLVSGLTGQGATVQIIARKKSRLKDA